MVEVHCHVWKWKEMEVEEGLRLKAQSSLEGWSTEESDWSPSPSPLEWKRLHNRLAKVDVTK